MQWSSIEKNTGGKWATTVFPAGPQATQEDRRPDPTVGGIGFSTNTPVILRPPIHLAKFLGMSPCMYNKSTNANMSGVSLSWPEAAFSFIALGSLVFASYTILNGLYQIFSTFEAGFKVYVLLIQMFISGIAGGVSIIVSLWESANLNRLLQDIVQTVNEADVISGTKPRSSSLQYRPAETIGFLTLTLATYVIELGNYVNYHNILQQWVTLWQLIPVAWVLFTPVIVDSTFSTCCYIINRGFVSLMTAVQNLQHSRHNVKEIRRLHLLLLDQCGSLSSLYGLQLLFILIHVRLQIITDLFLVLAELRRNEFAKTSLIGLTSLCIRVARLVYCPEIVYEQERKFARAIGQVDPSSWDNRSYEQILQRQVTSLKPRFTTCGVFALDYELFQEIVATTTTYLIVLVQFQIWKF